MINTRAYDTERAWIELNERNLKHNVRILERDLPSECAIMAVVKAEAYGHGASRIAAMLNCCGIRSFAVATLNEGIILRENGVLGDILVLGYTPPAMAEKLAMYDLTQTLIDYSYAERLNKQGYLLKVHLKIDTGMHRLGYDPMCQELIVKTFQMRNFNISGIFTHLCVSDSWNPEDIAFTHRQIHEFYRLLNWMREHAIPLPKIHIQSSYGFMNYPELQCSYVRFGIALYGVYSHPNDRTKVSSELKPVLSLKTKIVLVRNIAKGESAGYGRAFRADRDTRAAILPIGYADGIPRALSCGKGKVLLRGQYAPILGRICMDQLAVDVTDIDVVNVGDVATIIGKDGKEEITASQMAEAAGTIANELLSRLGKRLTMIENNVVLSAR